MTAPLAETLTAREQEILSLVTQEWTNRQIADELVLAHSTVRWYLRQIYAKLGVAGRPEAVARAQALGLAAPAVEAPGALHNLPAAATPLVGRQKELQALDDFLVDPQVRLLTIVGPGGIGKTRLALALAARQSERQVPGHGRFLFPDGVWYTSLAPIEDVAQLIPLVAETLGLEPDAQGAHERRPEKQVARFLSDKQLLLLLDNFEHLMDAAPLVAGMLQAAPALKVLVTSRQRLRLQGEHLFWLQGLELPEKDSGNVAANPAVRLFTKTSQRLLPTFDPDKAALRAIVQVCHLLEGMPLAIELAASWAGVLSPEAIAREVRQGLDILVSELHDVPDRHRSMQVALQGSWERLERTEQDLFRQLGVFRGGFTLEAAQAIAQATPGTLQRLLDRSWLTRDESGRFQLHELLRQFAGRQLSHSPEQERDTRQKHSHYYCAFLSLMARDLQGPQQQVAWTAINREFDNLRVAWRWAAVAKNVTLLEQAMFGLAHFLAGRVRWSEGEALCRLAAAELATLTSPDALRLRATLLAWQSWFDDRLGNYEHARQLCQQGLDLLDNRHLAGQDLRVEKAHVLAMNGLGHWEGLPERERRLRQSLALLEELGDRWWAARVLTELGDLAVVSANYSDARHLMRKSLAYYQSLGDRQGISEVLNSLVFNALPQGRYEEAARAAREYLAIRQELGDRAGLTEALFFTGMAFIWAGRFSEGAAMLKESLPDQIRMATGRAALTHAWLGHASCQLGDYEKACAQIEHGLSLFQVDNDERAIAHWFLGRALLALEAHGEAQAQFEMAERFFRREGIPSELGLVTGHLALVAYQVGNVAQAAQYLQEALQIAVDVRAFTPLSSALPVASLFYADRGNAERAVELHALLSRYRPMARSRWFYDVVGHKLEAVALGLPPAIANAARERGRSSNLWQTAENLLAEFADGARPEIG